MNHKGKITIETERLILRRFTLDDAGAMYRNWAKGFQNNPQSDCRLLRLCTRPR